MFDNTVNGNETWVLTPAQLEAVFDKAERGSTLLYAVGPWITDYMTADYAYSLYKNGEAELVQKKLTPPRYEYRIMKR